MNWISARLAEPSTRLAVLAGLAGLTHLVQSPPVTQTDWVGVGFGALATLAGILTKAPGSPDAAPATPSALASTPN